MWSWNESRFLPRFFPLGFCRNVKYNNDINDIEGGEHYDERRSDKGFLLQDDPARGGRRADVCILRSTSVKNGELDYLWLWILCGLPFGIWRLRLWIIPGGGSMGGGIALFALNFILAGIIGSFVLGLAAADAWRCGMCR